MKIAKFHRVNGRLGEPLDETVQFSWKAVATALVKYHGIHDGIWRLRLGGNSATYIQMNPAGTAGLVPAMLVPLAGVELVQDTELSPLSVDAAQVNPAPPRIIAPTGVM